MSNGRQRVPRTRAGGTWTEARYWAFIRSALRGAWSRYPVKHALKLENRREVKGKSHRFEYQCVVCNEWFPEKEVQVDHIEPAGSLNDYSDLPRFVKNLFCEKDNLQIMCKPHHLEKTKAEREQRKQEKANK